jgi:hypothetical protein
MIDFIIRSGMETTNTFQLTALYLYEGNSELHRLDEATYVSVTDPHIEPLTVIISSNKHNQTVTTGLIV